MALVHIDRNPSRRALLVFTWILPVFFVAIGLARWRAGSVDVARGLWSLGSLLFVLLLFVPRARRPVYLA